MQARAEIFTDLRPVLMKLARRMLRSEMEASVIKNEGRTPNTSQSFGNSGNPVLPDTERRIP